MTCVVMPEDEWLALCKKQCQGRRLLYPDDQPVKGGVCADDFPCPECVEDALASAPKQFHTTAEEALGYDPLPGCERDWP